MDRYELIIQKVVKELIVLCCITLAVLLFTLPATTFSAKEKPLDIAIRGEHVEYVLDTVKGD